MVTIREVKPALVRMMHWYRHDGWIRYVELSAVMNMNGSIDTVRHFYGRPWCLDSETSHKSSLSPNYDWLCFKVELEPLLEDIAKALGCSPVDILLSVEEA